MLSLEEEINALRPAIGDARADALIARERREVFSIHPELRVAAWLGATLLASAAGVLLKNNLERIGPLALAVMIGAAAAACYAWTWLRRARATLADDYILLLGALLVSADVAFIEAQFHVLGDAWKQHLLLLAVVHAIGAYAYGSRLLLSLSISALASWFGVDRSFSDMGWPSLIVAAILVAWRGIDARLHGPAFSRTFEHFAANVAFFGMLTMLDHDPTRMEAAAITVILAAVVIGWGFRTRHEPFVFYALVYAVIAIDVLILEQVRGSTAILSVLLVSMIAGIVALITLHQRFRELPR